MYSAVLLLALLLIIQCGAAPPIPDAGSSTVLDFTRVSSRKASSTYRLPGSVTPSHYELEIQPILEEGFGGQVFTAPGKIKVTISASESGVTEVTIHASTITIHRDRTMVRKRYFAV